MSEMTDRAVEAAADVIMRSPSADCVPSLHVIRPVARAALCAALETLREGVPSAFLTAVIEELRASGGADR